ncbi:MAG: carbon-nitrogen hydrolase family protein [Alphaproteobacteria bacterium]|nr:carbon-nitrogen hydrolase family protein [Alphaproteobacteria bacterium]
MSFKAGMVQLRSSTDPARNVKDASALIRSAASQGARFVSTPEMTNLFEPDRERLKAITRPEAEDLAVKGFSELAAKLGIWLHIGSLALKSEGDKLANRTLLFSPEGKIVARYDKIHLFDVDLANGEVYRESASYTGGQAAVVVETPLAPFGLTICYDVRFPALHRALAMAGAKVLLVPAAFTVPTGKAHWHVLLRARAIETGSFVIAAAQGGTHDSGRETFGHSKVIGPWGEVICECGTDPDYKVFEIDVAQADAARAKIPNLRHARDFDVKTVSAA